MTVKVFRSTDFGAPANTNAAGALIAILDACLVNGYGAQTVTSITRTDTTATVTTPSAHLLKDGTFMRISGAGQSDYNGDFAITVTGANTFTYTVANSPATPATGTITSKVAPADWTKPFTGTNVAAYKQGAGSNGMYLRIDDTTTSHPRAKSFETMTDVNTGTGDFPTTAQLSGGLYMNKSTSASAFPWVVTATEKQVIISIITETTYASVCFFGDILSNKSGDAFNTVLAANSSGSSAPSDFYSLQPSVNDYSIGSYIARSYTQIGGAVKCGKQYTLSGQAQMATAPCFAYPNPIDNALHIAQFQINESSIIRGKMPGIWNIHHTRPFQDYDVIVGTGDFVGKKFLVVPLYIRSATQCLLEISNTW